MTASPFRRLPEIITVLSVVGIIAWRISRTEEAPPEAMQCGEVDLTEGCFRRVPGATFLMGAQATAPQAPGYQADAEAHEGPPHTVTVSSFWMMQTEATVGQYRACVAEGACREDDVAQGGGFSTYYPHTEPPNQSQDTMPVNGISWTGARDLCAWLGGRLPTEAEWELAARGTDGRTWPWGDNPACPLPDEGVAFTRLVHTAADSSCEQDGPARASNLPYPSASELLGMAGNLWEWTADGYAPDAYTRHADTDPTTPPTDTMAQRGGSWTALSPVDVRATVRGGLAPDAQLNDVGARCAYGGAW